MGHESSGYTPIAGMHNRTQPKGRKDKTKTA